MKTQYTTPYVWVAVSCLEAFTLTSQTLSLPVSASVCLPSSPFLFFFWTLTLSLACFIQGASKNWYRLLKERDLAMKSARKPFEKLPGPVVPCVTPLSQPPSTDRSAALSPLAHKAIHAKCWCCRNCTSRLSIYMSPALQVNCLSDSAVMNIWFENLRMADLKCWPCDLQYLKIQVPH